jgi:8-amino-7-oxononanoate synthase
VFSMDGDLAPLRALAARADARGAWLMVDDAHGFGVLGRSGGGIVEEQGLSLDEVPILIGTLGKAFGTFGAFVAGSETLIETLIQFGRTYIYTTALPPAVAAATRASLRLLRDEDWRREHLRELIARFRTRAAALGIPLLPSMTPIQPVPVGDDGRVLAMAERLREAGHWVGAIRPPTVPRGTARLRIALSAAHSAAQVDALVDALAVAWRALPADRTKP